MKHFFSPFNSQKETLRQGRFVFFGAEQPGGNWEYWDSGEQQSEDLQGELENRNKNLGEKVQDFKNLRSTLFQEFKDKLKNFLPEDKLKNASNGLWNKTSKLIADSVFGRGNKTPTMNQSLGRVDYRDVTEFNDYIKTLEQNIRAILIDEHLNTADDMDLAAIRNKFENEAEDISNPKANVSENQKKGLKKELSTNMTLQVQNLRTRIFNAYKNENMSQTEKNELWHRVTDLIEKSILEGVTGENKNFDTDSDKGLDAYEFKQYINLINANVQAILKTTKEDGGRVTDKYASQPEEKNENKEEGEKTEAQKFAEDLLMVSSHLRIAKKVEALMEADIPLREIANRVEVYRIMQNRKNNFSKNSLSLKQSNAVLEKIMSTSFDPSEKIRTAFSHWEEGKSKHVDQETITIGEFIARMINDTSLVSQIIDQKNDSNHEKVKEMGEEESTEKAEKAERLQVLLDAFEEKYPDAEYKPYLLKAISYLQKRDIDNAQKKVTTLIKKKGLEKYIDVEKSAKSDKYLAKSLRKGLKNTKLAAQYMIKSTFNTEAESTDESKEGISLSDQEKTSDTEKKAFQDIAENAENYMARSRPKAEAQYTKMVEALQKQGLNMELLEVLADNKDVLIESMQVELALKSSLDGYIKTHGSDNLGSTLQAYADMTGIGGGAINFSDENVKLAQEIGLAITTTIAISVATVGVGTFASTSLFARIGTKIPKMKKIMNGLQKVQKSKFIQKWNKGAKSYQKTIHNWEHAAGHKLGKVGEIGVEYAHHTLEFTAMQTLLRTAKNREFSAKYLENDFKVNAQFYAGIMTFAKSLGGTGKILGKRAQEFGTQLSKVGRLSATDPVKTMIKNQSKMSSYGGGLVAADYLATLGEKVTESVKEKVETAVDNFNNTLQEFSIAQKELFEEANNSIQEYVTQNGTFPPKVEDGLLTLAEETYKNNPESFKDIQSDALVAYLNQDARLKTKKGHTKESKSKEAFA